MFGFLRPTVYLLCKRLDASFLLLQVKTFRSMMHDDMMVGAFSHSTAVGKLRKDLPDVPVDARVMFPRYSLDEAETVCHYYLRYAYTVPMVSRLITLLVAPW